MIPEEWLKSPLVLPGLAASTVQELVRAVAEALGTATGADAAQIETAFLEAMRDEVFSVGKGVAIPHTELENVTDTVVCLVTLPEPLPLRTVDGRPPDIFLFILSKPDPHSHLLLLAHLARLAQSRTLRDGLRRARTPDEAVSLVRAAEMRHDALPVPTRAPPSTAHVLFFVSIGGEKVVDALLIDLVGQGFGEACVLEAQSLREAAAREVPIFAGFRDLFGDPGGRRVLILEATAERADAVIEAVRRISTEYRAQDARVSVVPIQTRWVIPAAAETSAPKGH